ncbi:hypothetical protein DV515_00006757 [Chloebia gouldiae]|uniref:Uncharacterized protein n=1 Tax=Chloebia gouldiae TaxID=44316 RepID=A0A3L8SJR2_CHLGU|nr:hypothetical protein DV515_00006757 [Chloebia gouldiae]
MPAAACTELSLSPCAPIPPIQSLVSPSLGVLIQLLPNPLPSQSYRTSPGDAGWVCWDRITPKHDMFMLGSLDQQESIIPHPPAKQHQVLCEQNPALISQQVQEHHGFNGQERKPVESNKNMQPNSPNLQQKLTQDNSETTSEITLCAPIAHKPPHLSSRELESAARNAGFPWACSQHSPVPQIPAGCNHQPPPQSRPSTPRQQEEDKKNKMIEKKEICCCSEPWTLHQGLFARKQLLEFYTRELLTQTLTP